MILYNVTVSIDESIHEEWLNWMRKIHIPDVMATGLFLEGRIHKVQSDESISYAIGYLCKDNATLQRYLKEFSPKLQKEHSEKFQGKVAAFRTLLDVVETYKG